jgi:hypothetical protein
MKRHFIVAGVSALCMALAPTVAFGTESPPPPSIVGQSNSAPANATAGNENTSGQLIGQSGGGSQSADQTAVNTQLIPIAAAPATSVQTLPVNLNVPVRILSPGDNGDVKQSNTAPATAEATNANTSGQLIKQSGGGGYDKKKDGGSGQTASQTAVNTQLIPIAAAPATSVQTLPINANVPVRIASPGDNGSVKQSNKAPADAYASNLNGSKQKIGQDGGYGGSQSASQTAINTQLLPIALAPATSVQTLPINANVPIRILSPGDDGVVKQSNKAPAYADASNVNGSFQAIGQGPGKKHSSWTGGGGSQSASQTAINTQLIPVALAPATSVQTAPLNVNAPIRFLDELPRLPVDPFKALADPVGTVGGALPVNPLALLASPTDALGALPLGTVTGLLPPLPIGGLI